MALSAIFLRLGSAFTLACVTATCVAQSTPALESHVKPALLKHLQASQSESSKITLVETNGDRVRGVVTDLQTDYVSITVQYGKPSIHVPYEQIDHLDQPALTKHAKVILGVVVTASVIGVIFIVTAMIKHA